MIKINLLAEAAPQAAKKKRPTISLGARQGDIILLTLLGLAAVAVGVNWYLLTSARADRQAHESELREERDRLQVFIDKVKELEQKRDTLKHRISIIEELKKNQHGPVRIMDEVSRALPDLVWLDRMSVTGNVVTLNGNAMDENAVANYISNLDASPFFQEPALVSLSRGGQGVYNFQLTCVFTYTPPEIEATQGAGPGA
jgi:type IV pilus assembly protein PilN